MPQNPAFPYTRVDDIVRWFSFHHSIANRRVPLFLTPDGMLSSAGFSGTPRTTIRQGVAMRSILTYCRDRSEPLCVIGAKWSLSNILDPQKIIVDPGAFNQLTMVNRSMLEPAYATELATNGNKAVLVQGGANIGYVNQRLGAEGFALATSGANDGHRLAGCIATGSHGSALRVGAVHDTVVGISILTGPNRGVFLQPSTRRFTPALASWFETNTTIPTDDIADDQLFHAAQVALGGLGFVHSVVLEAVPLYQLEGRRIVGSLHDSDIWTAMETLDTRGLDARPDPYHFAAVLSPYAKIGDPGAFATLLWKIPTTTPFAPPSHATQTASSDLTRLLSALVPRLASGPVSSRIIEAILVNETASRYRPTHIGPKFPGQAFGPTSLPPGNGRSTEIVVDHRRARDALLAILAALRQEATRGRHLLGGIGVRFVPRTKALLGMNIHEMNMYIELPSLGSNELPHIYNACWRALQDEGINYTCHWGQEYGMSIATLQSYFGTRVADWKAAQQRLLTDRACQAVFTNPLLEQLSLA